MSLTDPKKMLHDSIGRQLALGGILGAALIFGVGGWSVATSIDSAVIAPGTVVVEGSRKAVQHDAGGIVEKINIKNGDVVEKGDILIRLDGEQIAAEIAALEKRSFDYQVRRYRLGAERRQDAELNLPTSLLKKAVKNPELAEIVVVQRDLLTSRLNLRRGRRKQLNEQVGQLRQEIAGLEQVRKSAEEEMALFNEEVTGLDGLHAKRLVNMARYSSIRRNAAQKRGILGQTIAAIARAKGRISETELQIVELDVTASNEIFKELEAIEGELAQLSEKLRAARDRYARLDIRASDRGTIHELSIHTVGGVVRPGDTLAKIVPIESELVIDANVATVDRDQIWKGMPARVRFTAFNQRTTPEIEGTVERIASDQSVRAEGVPPYYAVRVKLTGDQIARLGKAEIIAGMPAEVMMTAGERTVISYLTKPLTDQLNRVFRD